jgi:hypothetical protein
MTVLYHPEFARDIRRFAGKYREISPALAERFRTEVDECLLAIITNPTAAGHFLNTWSSILREVRRRNLDAFPFFTLYALVDDRLIFGSLIPSMSNPAQWTGRFK